MTCRQCKEFLYLTESNLGDWCLVRRLFFFFFFFFRLVKGCFGPICKSGGGVVAYLLPSAVHVDMMTAVVPRLLSTCLHGGRGGWTMFIICPWEGWARAVNKKPVVGKVADSGGLCQMRSFVIQTPPLTPPPQHSEEDQGRYRSE